MELQNVLQQRRSIRKYKQQPVEKEKIEEIKNSNTKEIKSDITQNIQNKIEDLKKKKNRLIRRLYRRVYRLKKAFPDIQSNEITEILAKKIILIKNKKEKTKEEKWYRKFI